MLVIRHKPWARRYRLAVAFLVVVLRILEHPEVAAVSDSLRCASLVVTIRFESRFEQARQEAERHRVYDMYCVGLDKGDTG